MRTRCASGAHADLTTAEVQRAKGVIEHLYCISLNRQRRLAAETGQQAATLRHWMSLLTLIDSSSADTEATSVFAHKAQLDALQSHLQHYSLLYSQVIASIGSTADDEFDAAQVKSNFTAARTTVDRISIALQPLVDDTNALCASIAPEMQQIHMRDYQSSDVSAVLSQRVQKHCHDQRLIVQKLIVNSDVHSLPMIDSQLLQLIDILTSDAPAFSTDDRLLATDDAWPALFKAALDSLLLAVQSSYKHSPVSGRVTHSH